MNLSSVTIDKLLDELEARCEAGVVFLRAEMSGRVGKNLRWWGSDTDTVAGLAFQAANLISRESEPEFDEESIDEDEEESPEQPLEQEFPHLGQYL